MRFLPIALTKTSPYRVLRADWGWAILITPQTSPRHQLIQAQPRQRDTAEARFQVALQMERRFRDSSHSKMQPRDNVDKETPLNRN